MSSPLAVRSKSRVSVVIPGVTAKELIKITAYYNLSNEPLLFIIPKEHFPTLMHSEHLGLLAQTKTALNVEGYGILCEERLGKKADPELT